MPKRLFPLASLKTGLTYHLEESEIRGFYDEHIAGALGNETRPDWAARNGFVVRGSALLELRDGNGELKDCRAASNLVVDTGKAAVIDRLQGTSVGVHDYQGIGTGTNAAAAGDTTLQTEIGTRIQGALSQPVATTDRLVSIFPAANGTGALTETGRFTAISAGNLFARLVFSVVNKAAADSLTITHDISVT